MYVAQALGGGHRGVTARTRCPFGVCVRPCQVGLSTEWPKAADTQDRYLSGIRPVRFMAICSESVHPLAIME